LENSGKDFIDLLKSNSWGDVETVLAKFTDDLIDLIMDTLSNATSVILKVIRLGIASIKSLGNYNIECPIITDLWNLATGGRPLSLFNFFGLLIALPTTVLMKVTTGKKPPGLKSRLTGDTLGQLIEKGNVSGDSSLSSDIISVMVPALISTLFLSARVTALSLIWDSLSDVGGMGTSSSAVMKQSNVSLSVSKLSLASPVNPTVNFFAQAGAGRTVGLAASKTPLHENVFDVVALAFETGGLCFSWPPFHMNATYVQEADILRWSVRSSSLTSLIVPKNHYADYMHTQIWFLDLTNDAAIIITRAIGGVQDIARATTKRASAILCIEAPYLPCLQKRMANVLPLSPSGEPSSLCLPPYPSLAWRSQ
jgi:hypothetical protein